MAKRDPKWTGFYYEHEAVHSDTEGPSRTRQEFAEECDINTIMLRYEATGIISHVDPRQPMYLDLTMMPGDLASTLDMLDRATESFMSLPASVRREMDNSVENFIAFATNEANLPKLKEWGLAKPEAALPDVVRVEVVNSKPSPEGGGGSEAPQAPSGGSQ
ncbi:VP3 [Gokushovirus WZ-2015a]|nr:VP3 [Gokushovirus WZ-2015a]